MLEPANLAKSPSVPAKCLGGNAPLVPGRRPFHRQLCVVVEQDKEQLAATVCPHFLERETKGAHHAVIEGAGLVLPASATFAFASNFTLNGQSLPTLNGSRFLLRAYDQIWTFLPREFLRSTNALEVAGKIHVVRPSAAQSLRLDFGFKATPLPPFRAFVLIGKLWVTGATPSLHLDGPSKPPSEIPNFSRPGDAFIFDPAQVGVHWSPVSLQRDADYGALMMIVIDLWPMMRCANG